MPIEGPALTSVHNPHVKYARSLQVRKNRYRERAFLVEGTRLFLDALDTGARPSRVFFQPERAGAQLSAILESLAVSGIPIHPAASAVIDSIADTQTPQGIVAIFEFPDLPVSHRSQALPVGDC